jgi:hypothetical protein
MAKVKLSAMLVTGVEGPLGNTSWKTGDREQVIVKQKQTPGRFKKPFRTHRINPMLISPPTLYADCDAWKTADAAYTQLPSDVRAVWRASIGRPGFSTYDVYMKQAIPHLLRGYPASDLPQMPVVAEDKWANIYGHGPEDPMRGTTGWPLKRLVSVDSYVHGRGAPGCTALPPPSCQTQGLHFLAVDWRRATISAPGAMNPAWGVRLLWGFNDGHPKDPDRFLYSLDVMSGTASDDQHYNFVLQGSGEALPTFFVPFRPTYISFECYPCVRTADTDEVYLQFVETQNGNFWLPQPDNSRLITVKYLNDEENFIHWPRWWPSRKISAVPLNLPLLHVWSDDPPVHWWPRGA